MSREALAALYQRARDDPAFLRLLLDSPLAAADGWDLTEEERLELLLPNFGWLLEGELAGSSMPRNEDALAYLRSRGVAALVSLSEQPLEPGLLARHGLRAHHVPLADFTAPTVHQVASAVATIDRLLAGGDTVAVHCGAGLGRTGTILACYLVSRGATAADAIARVRARRPGSVETPDQEATVARYEGYLKDRCQK